MGSGLGVWGYVHRISTGCGEMVQRQQVNASNCEQLLGATPARVTYNVERPE